MYIGLLDMYIGIRIQDGALSELLEVKTFRRKAFRSKCGRVPESATDKTYITIVLYNI